MSILPILASALLMVPPTGDPTAQPDESSFEGRGAATLPMLAFGGAGVTGVTFAAWVRLDKRFGLGHEVNLIVSAMCSVQASRATAEGGPELPDLLGDAYLTSYVPLSASGTWSASCLLGRSDLAPSTCSTYRYGVYAVNYKSDTPFTLNVGGAERECAASPSKAVFNIVAASSSTSVSIAADSPSASINFGIAHNPFVQFFSVGSQWLGANTSWNSSSGGAATNEWRMAAFRAMIQGSDVVTRMDMFRPSSRCENTQCHTNAMWQVAANFATNATVRFMSAYPGGMEDDNGNKQRVRWYAPKARACWMDDEELELWRDKDIAEIRRRGMQ